VLLMSSLTMVLGHHAHVQGDMRRMRHVDPRDRAAGAGVHRRAGVRVHHVREGGPDDPRPRRSRRVLRADRVPRAHVTVGIIILLGLYALSLTGKVKSDQHVKTEMVGLYWHFVDIIWVLIFVVVYLIPAG
jgi:hypothetical protein